MQSGKKERKARVKTVQAILVHLSPSPLSGPTPSVCGERSQPSPKKSPSAAQESRCGLGFGSLVLSCSGTPHPAISSAPSDALAALFKISR